MNARDTAVVATVPCPVCKARVGQPCQNPFAHQFQRGPEDRRAQPAHCHGPRRAAWYEFKKQQENPTV